MAGNWRPLGAHTTPNPSKIAEALARRVQWAVREELELDDPALQGLAAEPVVDLTVGDASSDAHRQQTQERAQRQEQRAQEEHGVTKMTASRLPSPGADKRVTRGMKARTE
jgi:hypothetical protein